MSDQTTSIPTHVASDYVELACLIIFFSIGAPVNLVACQQLGEKTGTQSYNRLHLLKKHLNLTDLLIIFGFIPSKVCWIVTYSWQGGDFMCRGIKFMHAFSFQISSNVIVCIAIDRLMGVFCPVQMSRKRGIKRVKILLLVCWTLGAVTSAPQAFVWGLDYPFEGFPQCSLSWNIEQMKLYNRNETETPEYQLLEQKRVLYQIYHLLNIFWLPVAVVVLCYAAIALWVFRTSKLPSPRVEQRLSFGSSMRSTVTHYFSKTSRQENSKVRHLSNTISNDTTRIVTFNDSSLTKYGDNMIHINRTRRRVRRSAVRISFLLVSAYMVCWLPYNCLSLWKVIDHESYHDIRAGENLFCFHMLIVFNSVINPFLYGTFGKVHRFARNS